MKFFLLHIIILALLLCISCGKKDIKQEKEIADFELGLLPTADCIPFSYAEELGIFDSLGIKVHITIFNSQMDVEEYLCNGKIDVGASDLIRTMTLQAKRKKIKFLQCSNREWQLISNRKKRINKVNQLGERLLGMTRNSVVEYICDSINKSLPKNKSLLLKPQINNIGLRLQMLHEGQIDAALLPTPLASQAIQLGHNLITFDTQCLEGLSGFAVNSNLAKEKKDKLGLLIKAYNLTVDRIKQQPIRTLSPQIAKQYRSDSLDLDYQKSKRMSHLYKPTKKSIDWVKEWSNKKKIVEKSYTIDTLLVE